MPPPTLKYVYVRHESTQTYSLGVCDKGENIDGGGKFTQERIIDANGAKVTAKKESKNCQMQTKTRLMKKESRKNHALLWSVRH